MPFLMMGLTVVLIVVFFFLTLIHQAGKTLGLLLINDFDLIDFKIAIIALPRPFNLYIL